MKSLPLSSILLLVSLVCATPRDVVAQSALLEALPADTLAVLSVDDIDELKASFAKSPMGQLWQDAALAAVREEVDLLMGELDGSALEETGISPFELLGMVHGPACMAMVAYEPEADSAGGELTAAATWMFDTGEDLEAFSEGFDRFVDWFVEAEGIVLKTESYDDVDVAVLVSPGDESSETRYGFVGSVLVVTTESVALGRDLFGEIVDGLEGNAESGFAADSAFADSVAAAPGSSIRVWGDLGEFIRRTWEAADEDAREEMGVDMDDMGLTQLGAVAVGLGISERGMQSTAKLDFVGLGWLQEVLVAGVSGQDPMLMQWMPDSASMAYTMDLDLGEMFDAFLGITMQEDPEEARDIIAGMAEMEADIGFHLRDDLLDNMNGQIGVFLSEVPMGEGIPMAGPTDPAVNYCLMLGLADGEAMGALLDSVIRSQGLHAARQLEEFEGYTIYSVPFFPGMSACYAALDDLLVLSLSPSMVKDVLRRKGNPELPSMATVEGVTEREATLPTDRTMFSCQDAADQMAGVLASVAMFPMIFMEIDPDMDMEDLPFLGLIEALGAVDPTVVETYYRDSYGLGSLTLSEQGVLLVSSTP